MNGWWPKGLALFLVRHPARAVTLTRAGRRLHGEARGWLAVADQVGEVMAGIRGAGELIHPACSHSAAEAFVAAMLASGNQRQRVELVTANSQVVRGLVADVPRRASELLRGLGR